MRSKNLLATGFLFLVSVTAWSSDIIVCIPIGLSFDRSSNKLAILPKVEEPLPDNYSGVLCNSSRSWCKEISLRANVPTIVEVSADDFSSTWVYFQTEYAAKNNYGRCEWSSNM